MLIVGAGALVWFAAGVGGLVFFGVLAFSSWRIGRRVEGPRAPSMHGLSWRSFIFIVLTILATVLATNYF